jgi:hypothetical protein
MLVGKNLISAFRPELLNILSFLMQISKYTILFLTSEVVIVFHRKCPFLKLTSSKDRVNFKPLLHISAVMALSVLCVLCDRDYIIR